MEDTYYNKFINFFENHNLYDKKVFDYIWEKCYRFSYLESEYRNSIGIYYIFDKKKRLVDFNLIVPFIESKKTLLINIHEYMHAIEAYYKIGKKFIVDETLEVNSLLFEKLYLLENKDKTLINYVNELNTIRIDSNDDKYVLGLKVANDLIENYNTNNNLEDLSRKSKKLMRKYKYQK